MCLHTRLPGVRCDDFMRGLSAVPQGKQVFAELEREIIRNTFPSGVGRELASDYQRFVAELGLLAAVEA